MSEVDPTPAPSGARPPTPLEELAARAANGNDAAFEELHRRLGGGLRRFLQRRLGANHDAVEDVGQAAWVEVWQSLRAGRYDASRARISTFVYAVAYKLLLRHYRTFARAGTTLGNPLSHADAVAGDADFDAALHTSELLEALAACLRSEGGPNSLTADERRVVLGSAERQSERDLARILGIAPSTVHARKESAYAKLRKCLRTKGFAEEALERATGEAE